MCHRGSGLLRSPCTSLERIRSSSDREAWHTMSAGGESAGTTTQGWGCGWAPHGKGHSSLTTDRAPRNPGPRVCGASISCPQVGRQPSRISGGMMCRVAPLPESKPPEALVSLVLETKSYPSSGAPPCRHNFPAHLSLQSLLAECPLRTPHSGPSRGSPGLRADAPQSRPCSLTKSVLTRLPA